MKMTKKLCGVFVLLLMTTVSYSYSEIRHALEKRSANVGFDVGFQWWNFPGDANKRDKLVLINYSQDKYIIYDVKRDSADDGYPKKFSDFVNNGFNNSRLNFPKQCTDVSLAKEHCITATYWDGRTYFSGEDTKKILFFTQDNNEQYITEYDIATNKIGGRIRLGQYFKASYIAPIKTAMHHNGRNSHRMILIDQQDNYYIFSSSREQTGSSPKKISESCRPLHEAVYWKGQKAYTLNFTRNEYCRYYINGAHELYRENNFPRKIEGRWPGLDFNQ